MILCTRPLRDGIKSNGKFAIFTRLKIDIETPPSPYLKSNFSSNLASAKQDPLIKNNMILCTRPLRDGIKSNGKFAIFTRLKIDIETPPSPYLKSNFSKVSDMEISIFSPNFSEIYCFHPPSPYL